MSTFLNARNGTKARKPYRCCLCGERINVGDTQDRRTGISYGSVWTMYMHPECHAYEQTPGVVDPDWYEEIGDPAFSRFEAVTAMKEGAK